MRIEEAIFYLKNTPVIASNADKENVQKAYDMAIEALNCSEIPNNCHPYSHGRESGCLTTLTIMMNGIFVLNVMQITRLILAWVNHSLKN